MKKFLYLIVLIMSCSCLQVFANQPATEKKEIQPIEENKQYIELPFLPSKKPKVTYVFSFYCPSCKLFEQDHVITKIAQRLPKNVEFNIFHSNVYSSKSALLSNAWTIATILNVRDKVILPLFELALPPSKIHHNGQIMDILNQYAGITNEKYQEISQSYLFKHMMEEHKTYEDKYQFYMAPMMVVNEHYFVRLLSLDTTSAENFENDVLRVVNHLLDIDKKKSEVAKEKPKQNKKNTSPKKTIQPKTNSQKNKNPAK